MLHIKFDNGKVFDWLVGDPKNEFQMVNAGVIEVIADGHELDHINHKFSNLPMNAFGNVVSWFGDHAKFIVANL